MAKAYKWLKHQTFIVATLYSFDRNLQLAENFWAKSSFRLKYSLSKVVFLTKYLKKLNQILFYAIVNFLYYSFKRSKTN
ncbi:hypothetical protein B7486_45380 [cyanobacterium TDX16]|nr:hypothetical protein B7486_45380 [cyanobacterium TDX16]